MTATATEISILVPTDEEFDDSGFLLAEGLRDLAGMLLSRHPTLLGHIAQYRTRFLWRREGGQSKGREVIGQCSRPGAMIRFLADVDFVVWLAADHCRALNFGPREVEAALFHELLHIAEDEDGKPGLAPHDFEGFLPELNTYGPWRADLASVTTLAKQLPLGL